MKEEEGLTMTHPFRGFNPWSLVPMCLATVLWQLERVAEWILLGKQEGDENKGHWEG